MESLISYIIEKADGLNLRYEVNRFPSGAAMIDIWVKHTFCVIQLYQDEIGMSLFEKGDVIPFDSRPDRSFKNEKVFKDEFEKMLSIRQ
ncbi:hypothetical protein ACLOAU_01450 [Niabella sp. CJ426]|uniref:hypothetical protein n=1 Tax=Niabella sp. CJ426 TaxID=3393740 RepID=UPI003D0306B4